MYFDRAFGAHLYVYTDLFGRVWAAPGPFSFLSRRRAVFDMQGFWEIYDPKWHGDLSADERE